MSIFKRKLKKLINEQCVENNSNTPDYVLADFLSESLKAFEKAVCQREAFYGRSINRGKKKPCKAHD